MADLTKLTYINEDTGVETNYDLNLPDHKLTEAKVSSAFLPSIKNAYVTPEMYGAKGDGTTDDAQALQSAINSTLPVLLGVKTYACGSALSISVENKTIAGLGYGSIIKFTAATNGFNLSTWKPCMMNLTLDGSDTALNGVQYNRNAAASNGIMSDVLITNFTGYAVHQGEKALYALKYRNVVVRNCGHGIEVNSKDSFYNQIDIDKTDGYGMRVLGDATSNLFSDVKIAEGAMTDRSKAGLAIVGHRNTFSNVHLQDNGGNGLFLYGSYNVIDGIILDANSANTLFPAADEGDHLYAGAVILGDHNTVVNGNAQNYRGKYQKIAYICRPNTKNVIDIQLNGQSAIGCGYEEELEYVPRKFSDIKTDLTTNSGSMSFDSTDGTLKPTHYDYFSLPFGSYAMRFKVKSLSNAKLVQVGTINVRVGAGSVKIYDNTSQKSSGEFTNDSSYEDVFIEIYPEQRNTGVAYVLMAKAGDATLYYDVSENTVDVFRGAGQENLISEFLISKQDSSKYDKNTVAYVKAENGTAYTQCADSIDGRGVTLSSSSIVISPLW